MVCEMDHIMKKVRKYNWDKRGRPVKVTHRK